MKFSIQTPSILGRALKGCVLTIIEQKVLNQINSKKKYLSDENRVHSALKLSGFSGYIDYIMHW